ncbi:MAG: Smr/MutS family protein [Defluviicoccus sp.]|nr:Smr/MutS family protein [Defluviicoccus sp.]MDG4608085.1 Smr/MutS family protein [Defluviicoccus sp.]
MKGDRHGHSGADADDLSAWQRYTRDVRRLGGGARTPALQPVTPAPQLPPLPPRPKAPAVPAVVAEQKAPGIAPGLDRRTLANLRRGRIPPQATIDLHGMTQAAAHRVLSPFVVRAQADGKRCVLVITGKGYGTEGAIGVLKTAVPRWLNEPPLVARILGFCHAPPALGGEGALLILLRRIRPRMDEI